MASQQNKKSKKNKKKKFLPLLIIAIIFLAGGGFYAASSGLTLLELKGYKQDTSVLKSFELKGPVTAKVDKLFAEYQAVRFNGKEDIYFAAQCRNMNGEMKYFTLILSAKEDIEKARAILNGSNQSMTIDGRAERISSGTSNGLKNALTAGGYVTVDDASDIYADFSVRQTDPEMTMTYLLWGSCAMIVGILFLIPVFAAIGHNRKLKRDLDEKEAAEALIKTTVIKQPDYNEFFADKKPAVMPGEKGTAPAPKPEAVNQELDLGVLDKEETPKPKPNYDEDAIDTSMLVFDTLNDI
ncbi:MAG: hypothetical protein LBM87_04935 [Ruminococcus sp.]|nr:hypothetical protein [Ruminococcus sp.]